MDDKDSDDDNKNCSICLLSLGNDIIELNCGHNFHFKCINDWMKKNNTCPLCREQKQEINNNRIRIIQNQNHFINIGKNIIYLSLLLLIVSSIIISYKKYRKEKLKKMKAKSYFNLNIFNIKEFNFKNLFQNNIQKNALKMISNIKNIEYKKNILKIQNYLPDKIKIKRFLNCDFFRRKSYKNKQKKNYMILLKISLFFKMSMNSKLWGFHFFKFFFIIKWQLRIQKYF